MANLRKAALWAAGVIIAGVIIALLIWPDVASGFSMALLLVAAALGAWAIAGQDKN